MPADQVAFIAPMIREMLQEGDGWCVRFSQEGNDSNWIEVAGSVLNIKYPHDQNPVGLLKTLGVESAESLITASWSAGVYATLEAPDREIYSLAKYVDQIFERVLGLGGDYDVDAEIFQLAS